METNSSLVTPARSSMSDAFAELDRIHAQLDAERRRLVRERFDAVSRAHTAEAEVIDLRVRLAIAEDGQAHSAGLAAQRSEALLAADRLVYALGRALPATLSPEAAGLLDQLSTVLLGDLSTDELKAIAR